MKLKELREKLGYTRKQACDFIGCSRTVYTRYENGDRQPSLPMLIRIADVFGVSLDCLVGREGPQQVTLSDWERKFLKLLRSSDTRAQEDAFNLLYLHRIIKEEREI